MTSLVDMIFDLNEVNIVNFNSPYYFKLIISNLRVTSFDTSYKPTLKESTDSSPREEAEGSAGMCSGRTNN